MMIHSVKSIPIPSILTLTHSQFPILSILNLTKKNFGIQTFAAFWNISVRFFNLTDCTSFLVYFVLYRTNMCLICHYIGKICVLLVLIQGQISTFLLEICISTVKVRPN
jgi:hypothetical protein